MRGGVRCNASPQQAQEIHSYIRSKVAESYGQKLADSLQILYGGSVKPSNAQELFAEPDIMLLDEPTNDLDVNTLRALEEALNEFVGTAVVISHDRWFLDRLCDSIIAFEGDGNVVYHDGSYSSYEKDRERRRKN